MVSKLSILARRFLILALSLVLIPCLLLADPGAATGPTEDRKLRFFSLDMPEDGIYYLPIGTHFAEGDFAIPNMLGLTYGPVSLAAYKSSVEGQGAILTLMHGREVFSWHRWGADFFFGIMYGYHGALAKSDTIPEWVLPMMEGEINPIAALSPYYSITDTWEARMMFTPGFASIGVKYRF